MSGRLSAVLGLAVLAGALSASAWGQEGPGREGRGRGGAATLGESLGNERLTLTYDARGITSLASPADPFGAALMRGPRMGLYGRYRTGGGAWADLATNTRVSTGNGVLAYRGDAESAVQVTQTFALQGGVLDWSVELAADGAAEVGDLAFVIPWTRPGGSDPRTIFEQGFIKHQFISGAGSFLYFVRPSGAGPYLVATVKPGTKLEYTGNVGGGGRGGGAAGAAGGASGFAAFVHSGITGNAEQRGNWRQPHTSLRLGPGEKVSYGLRLQWAPTYEAMRDVLHREGLFDFRIVPGMTLPEDLSATFSLRTRATIEGIDAEFPQETMIRSLGRKAGDHHLYEVQFRKLGENLLTVRHDGGRKTYLEFFCTEPLETLIKKRAAFIAFRQQWRDPSKWYDGLFSVYDMQAKKLRSPEDTDGWVGRNEYILASDDPALPKAPYVAAKNVHFPVREEIEAVEYYLREYVWGGLQRTDKEEPYPYGIYGIPNWHVQRDPELKRKFETEANRRPDLVEKMRLFRSYDYPHVVMLYYHMYEIATHYPQMVTYLDANGYLERAYQTARAYFLYPHDLLPGYYETYKWGCYNELLIPRLIETLEAKGQRERADFLRAEWEKKVKYFVYDDPYPFRSEYAFDRTAFESSYALAKYGATTPMKADEKLWRDFKIWFDRREEKWYSHPSVRMEDSRAFMERQHMAGLAVRGWLEPAYYLLGADATGGSGSMSYMAQMGGWSVLDYGVNFAENPRDSLQLGYNSYLSAWALMNTGRPETNYGFWFPGKEDDGATGWTFLNAKYGRGWYGKDDVRGPWHYDGEIDLGYGAGLRMASTLLTRDPIMDWVAYGGTLTKEGDRLSIVPRDGLRKRFYAVVGEGAEVRRFKMELDRDGFAAGEPIAVDPELRRIAFAMENRTGDSHKTTLAVSFPKGRAYSLMQDGKPVSGHVRMNWDYPAGYTIEVPPGGSRIELLERAQ